jgi:hypothetical protein
MTWSASCKIFPGDQTQYRWRFQQNIENQDVEVFHAQRNPNLCRRSIRDGRILQPHCSQSHVGLFQVPACHHAFGDIQTYFQSFATQSFDSIRGRLLWRVLGKYFLVHVLSDNVLQSEKAQTSLDDATEHIERHLQLKIALVHTNSCECTTSELDIVWNMAVGNKKDCHRPWQIKVLMNCKPCRDTCRSVAEIVFRLG